MTGSFVGTPWPPGFCAWRRGWVGHLSIHPDHHNRGLGTALLARATTDNGSLRLWAFQRTIPALRCYAARGFRAVMRTDGRRNEEQEPEVLLCSMRLEKNP
jgi:GNAT superfamily N-acetyltransferase